jgi:hypothetical protein
MRRDHIVRRRDKSEVFDVARDVRRLLKNFIHGGWLDVYEAIKWLEGKKIQEKGRLVIKTDTPLAKNVPAQVTYNPLTLHVDPPVWRSAGDTNHFHAWAYARWVLFHELGHIFLHDHYDSTFTDDDSVRANYPPEERAEDQADWFAAFLACPLTERIKQLDSYTLATLRNIPEDIAEFILELAETYVEHKHGESIAKLTCPDCGSELERADNNLLCLNCEPTKTFML